MKFEAFDYKVLAKVTFTRAEYAALIKLAKAHYDQTCASAGLVASEVHPKWGAGREPDTRA